LDIGLSADGHKPPHLIGGSRADRDQNLSDFEIGGKQGQFVDPAKHGNPMNLCTDQGAVVINAGDRAAAASGMSDFPERPFRCGPGPNQYYVAAYIRFALVRFRDDPGKDSNPSRNNALTIGSST